MPDGLLGGIDGFDFVVLQYLRRVQTPILDPVMTALSAAARGGVLWMVLGGLVAFIRPFWRPAFFQLLVAIGLAGLLADVVLKPLADRSRPFDTRAEFQTLGRRPASRSFPSGHAATSFAGAYALGRMLQRASVPIWILATLVSFSRIYLGMHYPLDVIGGGLVGLAAALFVVGGTRWYSDQLTARRFSESNVAR